MQAAESITVKGREFGIEVERVRSRTARVSIRGSTIRMRLPYLMSESDAAKTYSDFRGWALRRLERMKDYAELDPRPGYLPLSDGQALDVMGRAFTIRITQSESRTRSTVSADGIVAIRLGNALSGEELRKAAYLSARRLISGRIAGELTAHVRSLNARHFGFELGRVSIRDQATRWGSCSRRTGNININFRLLLAPEGIRDYVIIHELAHLRHGNHSARFWKLVESAVPDYRQRRRWLNRNGRLVGTGGLTEGYACAQGLQDH